MNTPAADDRTADVTPDAEQARSQLAEAQTRSRTVPTAFPVAFITFGMLCVVGSLGVIAMHLASRIPQTPELSPRLLVMVMTIVWVLVAMVPIFIVRGERWRRGLGRRWVALMVAWAALWGVGMALSTNLAAMWIAPMFIVLFAIGVTGEAANKASKETLR